MRVIAKNPHTGPFKIKGSNGGFPFDEGSTLLTNNARGAIALGVGAIGLNEGDEVLVPVWNCGSELDALIKSGLRIRSYRLHEDMSANLDDIRSGLINGAKAVYLIHYFGYPQPVSEVTKIAGEFGAKVIEDLALGLFSKDETGQSLGQAGDISVFSLVKTLNLPDGGALWLREPKRFELAGSKLSKKRQLSFLKKQVSGARKSISSGSDESEDSLDGWNDDADFKGSYRLSGLSRFLLGHCDVEQVIAKRCENYDRLHEGLMGLSKAAPLMDQRPKGAVPAYFPLLADDARLLASALRDQQIEPVRFWRRFYPDQSLTEHPRIEQLKRSVIRLPIHHDLGEGDVDRMIDVVQRFNKSQS